MDWLKELVGVKLSQVYTVKTNVPSMTSDTSEAE